MKDDKALGRWAGAGRGLCPGWSEAPLRETCTVRRSQGTTGRKSAQAEERACSKALRLGTQGLRDRRPVWLGGGRRRRRWGRRRVLTQPQGGVWILFSVLSRAMDLIKTSVLLWGQLMGGSRK